MSKQELRADHATILRRLAARNESMDRRLEAALAARGLGREGLAEAAERAARLPPERTARAVERAAAALGGEAMSWEELTRPSLAQVARGTQRMMRA